MLKNIKNSTILHPILFAILPIIFLFSQSSNILPFGDFVFPLVLSIFVTIILLIITRFILKNKIKSSLIISLFVFLSLNFGHFKNWFSNSVTTFELEPIHFLVFYGILFVVGTAYLIKTKRKLDNATILTNVFSVILVVIVLVNIGSSNIERTFYDQSDSYGPDTNLTITKTYGMPDVYVLVLDAYANNMVLEKFFEYNNEKFLDALIEQGFFVPSGYTNSNYVLTDFTIPSFLNMNYLDNLISPEIPDNIQSEHRKNLANNNIVMQNFKELGYKNIGIDSGWAGTKVADVSDEYLCENSSNERILSLLKQNTIIQTIDQAVSNSLSSDSNLNIANIDKVSSDHYKRKKVFCNFSELNNIPGKFEEPVFVYFHVLSPHTPWVFESNGDPPTKRVNVLTKDIKKRQAAYVNEMEFINSKVIESTKKIISDPHNKPIIIILSDHGTRIINENLSEDEKDVIAYGNLMAVYLPDNKKYSEYKTTPVNIFRIIFNSYFNGTYQILDNRVFEKSGNEIKDWNQKVRNVFN